MTHERENRARAQRKTVQGRAQMLFALSAKYVAPRRACMHNAQCIVHATYVVEKQSLTHDPNHADHAEQDALHPVAGCGQPLLPTEGRLVAGEFIVGALQ